MLNGKLDMIGGNDDIFQNMINSFMELHPYFYIHMKHDKLYCNFINYLTPYCLIIGNYVQLCKPPVSDLDISNYRQL